MVKSAVTKFGIKRSEVRRFYRFLVSKQLYWLLNQLKNTSLYKRGDARYKYFLTVESSDIGDFESRVT